MFYFAHQNAGAFGCRIGRFYADFFRWGMFINTQYRHIWINFRKLTIRHDFRMNGQTVREIFTWNSYRRLGERKV